MTITQRRSASTPRAAARFVHTASGFAARIRVARGGREMDGKSIMGLLLLAAAQGSAIIISADGAGRGGGDGGALRAGRARLRRRDMRLNGLGVSPGVGVGKALVLKGGMRDLRFLVPASLVPREIDRLDEARARSREQLQQIKARIAAAAGADHAYLFDAQLLMLDDAMLIERASTIIRDERLNAGVGAAACAGGISTLFDRGRGCVPPRTQGRRRRRRRTAVA